MARLKVWNESTSSWDYTSVIEPLNKEGLLIPAVHKTANFNASFDDNFYTADPTAGDIVAVLPETSAGDIGKTIFFQNVGSNYLIIRDIDALVNFYDFPALRYGDSVIMVATSTAWGIAGWKPLLYSKDWQANISAVEAQLGNYVPFSGGSGTLDFTGGDIRTYQVTGPDSSELLLAGATHYNVDNWGNNVAVRGSNAYGNGNGGTVYIQAGHADYDNTAGNDPVATGDGGIIYMQVGAGANGGARGHIRIDSLGFVGAASIYINDLTAERDLALPDASGTLLASEGSTKITTGTTAPSSPAVGDLWVDTN